MQGLRDAYRRLEVHIMEGTLPELSVVRELSGPDLLEADEHDVSLLLFLTALCSHIYGGESVSIEILEMARRYQEESILYTGRIIPRIKELIELLDRSVNGRSGQTLVEAADHLSQGWSAYSDSVFPSAFTRLADKLGVAEDVESFANTSFTCWQKGLEFAATNSPVQARALFEESLLRYRRYRYYADAAWLFTDIVITQLMAGLVREAATTLNQQRRYVEEILNSHPLAPDRDRLYAFQLGDVRSGSYSTFVESVTLYPHELTEQDREVMLRYVRTSEFLVEACRHRSRRDFYSALDLFSFGWTTFPDSPYPRILQHLAGRYGAGAAPWNVHLTAYAMWHLMLRMSRVHARSDILIESAVSLRDRLSHAKMRKHADVALLDAAILHAQLHGKRATVEWITRYAAELRPEIPEILRAATNYLQAPSEEGAERLLTPYAGLRSRYTAPDLIFATMFRRNPPGSVQLEVALYGRLLSLEGITVYEITPDPLVGILEVLGAEFISSRQKGKDIPLLSAAELSARTGRTPAALAQTVRRFRTTCQQRFKEATDWQISPDAVIQGRPGYRLNPGSVERFSRYPATQ